MYVFNFIYLSVFLLYMCMRIVSGAVVCRGQKKETDAEELLL